MAQAALNAADAINALTPWSLSVYSEIPPEGKTGHHLALVVGPMEIDEKRLTVPRGSWKQRLYAVSIYLIAVGKTGSVQDEFATAEELVSNAYATCLVPTQITDPVTQVITQLESVGEVIATTEDPPGVIEGQPGQFEMKALLRVSVTELITE